jgi:hypothetical protein
MRFLSVFKNKSYLLCGFSFALVLFFASSFISFLFHDSSHLNNIQNLNLENGDLIFRRGRSIGSYAVYLSDKNRDFSHIGVIVIQDDKPFVVHATTGESNGDSEFIRKDPLRYFSNRKRANQIAIYRAEIDLEDKIKVAQQAMVYYREKRTFDSYYDLSSDEKLYCSELVLKAYQCTKIDLSGIQKKELKLVFRKFEIIFPSAFINNSHFRKVFSN